MLPWSSTGTGLLLVWFQTAWTGWRTDVFTEHVFADVCDTLQVCVDSGSGCDLTSRCPNSHDSSDESAVTVSCEPEHDVFLDSVFKSKQDSTERIMTPCKLSIEFLQLKMISYRDSTDLTPSQGCKSQQQRENDIVFLVHTVNSCLVNLYVLCMDALRGKKHSGDQFSQSDIFVFSHVR